jgi:hypothetical protein
MQEKHVLVVRLVLRFDSIKVLSEQPSRLSKSSK